jgi:hypothetical protein
MADIREVEEDDEDNWKLWYETRPEVIQQLARRFRPWKLYRLRSSGHRVVLYAFNEDNTLTVSVLGRFNLLKFERRVFGIPPDDLEECDLPGLDEPLGVTLTAEEQLSYINGRRAENGFPPLAQAELDEMSVDGQCAME